MEWVFTGKCDYNLLICFFSVCIKLLLADSTILVKQRTFIILAMVRDNWVDLNLDSLVSSSTVLGSPSITSSVAGTGREALLASIICVIISSRAIVCVERQIFY